MNTVGNRVRFGLPMESSRKQNLLPVVTMPTAQVKGYVMIPETVFDGTESEFQLPEGKVKIASVTLPYSPEGTQNYGITDARISQYMAMVYEDNNVVSSEPWLGYRNFVDPVNSGFFQYWSMPIIAWRERIGLGNLIGFLVEGSGAQAAPTHQPPEVGNKEPKIRWAANLTRAAITSECPMFDFNWYTLFEVQQAQNPITGFTVPRTIDIDTVPPGFKVFTLYKANARPGTNIFLDSLRILINDPSKIVIGENVFEFTIHSEAGGPSVKASLTLNVVG